jgi:two-component system chemotaxis response regulator CheY
MSKRVLVVDDSVTMRELLMEAVRRVGDVEVMAAGDGVEAMQKLAANHFDLLITDIGMPVMDGLTLIGRIRARESVRSLPVVIMSAMGSWEERTRASELGVDEYIMKPVQAPQVIAVVKKLLGL